MSQTRVRAAGVDAPSPARSLLRLTGPTFFPLAFISRLPFAMTVVGVLTIISSVRGSVADGGAVSAVAGIGTAIFGPMVGALADRFGQRPVLLVCVSVNVVSLVGFLLLTYSAASIFWVGAIGFVVGASTPQVASLSRSRLVSLVTANAHGLERRKILSLVMSYESVADESAFVIGPVLIGVIATALGAGAPLAIAAGVAAFFVVAFALHPSARRAEPTTVALVALERTRSLVRPRILVLSAGMFFVGAFFGPALTALTAFMRDQRLELATGIVYGGMSVGSVLIAILIAFAPESFSLRSRWIAFGALALLATMSLIVATSVAMVAVGLAVAGCGIGAVIVTLFTTAHQRTPAGRTTTVMTMLSSALIVGQALFTALGGFIAENGGAGIGFVLTAETAAAVVMTGLVSYAMEGWRA
ncbi:MAG TPA: MFS transporter [Homoserinimonas sp.]|nr:MFS transporter [Homoserinimonas sp.]